jgi:hypothetical protein
MERTATHETSRGTATSIAGLIETPHGPMECVDAPGFVTMLIINPEDSAQSRVGFLLYEPEFKMGMVAQMDADQARMVAASFLRLADELSPRVDH